MGPAEGALTIEGSNMELDQKQNSGGSELTEMKDMMKLLIEQNQNQAQKIDQLQKGQNNLIITVTELTKTMSKQSKAIDQLKKAKDA